jgi:GTPase SAR1 family protein
MWDNAIPIPMTPDNIRGAHAIVIVFDLGCPASFEDVREYWFDMVNSAVGERQVVRFLIGNKSDLSTDERKVSYDDAKQAADLQGMSYFEVSCKQGSNVQEAFVEISREIMSGPKHLAPAPSKSYDPKRRPAGAAGATFR